MRTFRTRSARGTVSLGRRLAKGFFKAGDLVAIEGPLGAGKTVLVRGIAQGLGVADAREVCSPTFVLVREYKGDLRLFHIDLYRMGDPEGELAGLGLEEMLEGGVVLVEWAERACKTLPRPLWRVQIEIAGPSERLVRLERIG